MHLQSEETMILTWDKNILNFVNERTSYDLQQQTDSDYYYFLVALKIFSWIIFLQCPSSQDETLRKNIQI